MQEVVHVLTRGLAVYGSSMRYHNNSIQPAAPDFLHYVQATGTLAHAIILSPAIRLEPSIQHAHPQRVKLSMVDGLSPIVYNVNSNLVDYPLTDELTAAFISQHHAHNTPGSPEDQAIEEYLYESFLDEHLKTLEDLKNLPATAPPERIQYLKEKAAMEYMGYQAHFNFNVAKKSAYHAANTSSLDREEGLHDYDIDDEIEKVEQKKRSFEKKIEKEVASSDFKQEMENIKAETPAPPLSASELAFGYKTRMKDIKSEHPEEPSTHAPQEKKGPLLKPF